MQAGQLIHDLRMAIATPPDISLLPSKGEFRKGLLVGKKATNEFSGRCVFQDDGKDVLDGTASPRARVSRLSGLESVSFRMAGKVARRNFNERRPPCRHYVRG
jgi:hypothetical protein